MSHLVFDVESVAIANAGDYLEPATAPSNYKDPTAIASYIEKANAEAVSKAALDVDLARIVAIGWSDGSVPCVAVAKSEDDEREILTDLWRLAKGQNFGYDEGEHANYKRPTLIGFNCIGFDLPLLLRRSLYLGVKAPKLQIGKYRHDGIEDLMLSLSFDGALKYRGLAFYKRRFGLDVADDPHSGADIGRLVAEGNYDAVAAHCRADVLTTVALAQRMGVL